MTALVMGPVVYFGLPVEISRWHEAAAIEKRLNGDLEGAIAGLASALRWQPKGASIYLRRAGWRLDAGEYQAALDDYDRVLELKPRNYTARVQRTQSLQHLGRHQEAIADWKKLVDRYDDAFAGERASMLNGLAYARAVGKAELDAALADIDTALELIDGIEADLKPAKGSDAERYLMDSRAAMLDTRGFIQYRLGALDAAKRDLDTAVDLIENRLDARSKFKQYSDHREFDLELEQMRQSVAVIRYHRALVNDQIDQSDQAAQDRKRVRELGYEPNEELF
jgi:tetratricopeptide (TPR) repeat protein